MSRASAVNEALYAAVEEGSLEKMNEAVANGADVNFLCNNKVLPGWSKGHKGKGTGHSSLQLACWLSLDRAIIDRLIQLGADVLLKSSFDKHTTLHCASHNANMIDVVLLLIERGCNPNEPDKFGDTSMHWASIYGHKDMIEKMIDRGGDIKQINFDEKSCCFSNACFSGNAELVQLLLDLGSDIRIKLKDGRNGLHLSRSKEVAGLLLDRGLGADESADVLGYTPLLKACNRGWRDVVEVLLQRGADVNAMNLEQETALHLAAVEGHFEIVELLLARGADIRVKDVNGATALMKTCWSGKRKVVQLLIDNGSELKVKAFDGRNALHYSGSKEVVELLLELDGGSWIEEKDNEGDSPLLQACSKGLKEVVEVLILNGASIYSKNAVSALNSASFSGNLNLVKLLVELGLNPLEKTEEGQTSLHFCGSKVVGEFMLEIGLGESINESDNYGGTPLMYAAAAGCADVVVLFLDRGARVNDADNDGSIALHRASQGNCMGIVKILLGRGADIEQKDNEMWNALHEASTSGFMKVVQVLVRKGANIHVRDDEGATAILKACGSGNKDLVQYLLGKGANIKDFSNDGSNALHFRSSKQIVEVLFENFSTSGLTIHLNQANSEGHTCLHTAIFSGLLEVAELLISRGSNLQAKTLSMRTAAHMSGSRKVTEFLLDRGFDIESQDHNGYMPLQAASIEGFLDVAELLLERGANINSKGSDGANSLILSTESRHVEIVKLLLSKGSDIYEKFDYETAWHIAKSKGESEVSKIIERWPLTMLIVVLQDLAVYHLVDCYSFVEFLEYFGFEEENDYDYDDDDDDDNYDYDDDDDDDYEWEMASDEDYEEVDGEA